MAQVLGLDQAYFDTHSTSEIRGSMNVHTLNNLITWNVPYLVTLTFKMVMLAYFMLSINATLGGVSIAAYCVIKFGVLDPINAYEKVTHKVQRKLNIMNHQIMDEAFNMATSVKLFSKEAHHMHEHETSQLRYTANINAVVVLRCLREFSYGVLRVCIVGAVLYLGLSTFVASDMGAGDLTAFFLLLENFQHVFHRIKWHYEVLVREFPDIDRFLTLMQQKATVHSGDQKPANVRGEIVFRNVVFEYPSRPGEKALDGLDLTIRANKMTAIVGDSGAGKSTIAKLVMRLYVVFWTCVFPVQPRIAARSLTHPARSPPPRYDPTSGSITLDGTDVRELDLCYLHDQIAIVNQNPELFNASLAENIGYGATGDWTMADVERAAKLAHCHDFVAKFRGGYDTFAGCRGAQLSGGQKQRIAIARAAIRNSRVLILDEATSSLDAESEELVQAALENIMAGRTILVIAHRLSTIKNADEVLCMRGGEVVERGTHDELIARDGHYAQLVRKQLVEERYQQELKSELKSSSKKNGGGGNETSDESTTYTATTASPAHRGAPGFWTDDEEEDDGGEKKESPEKDATARAAAVVWERRPDRHRPRERLPRRPAAALGPLGRPVHAGRRWAGRRARARFADSGFPRVRLRRYATS